MTRWPPTEAHSKDAPGRGHSIIENTSWIGEACRSPHVIPDLEMTGPVHGLPGETAVADELAGMGLHNPEPETVLCVIADIPADPPRGSVAVLRCRIELHDSRIAEHCGHLVEVAHRHLAQLQPRRPGGVHRRQAILSP